MLSVFSKEKDKKNNLGQTPLMLAVQSGKKEYVQLLLKAGAKLEKDERAMN